MFLDGWLYVSICTSQIGGKNTNLDYRFSIIDDGGRVISQIDYPDNEHPGLQVR